MNSHYSPIKLLILVFIGLSIFIASCDKKNSEAKNMVGDGVLKGKISIGPICPVESVPPDPKCLPTAETYKAWATAVWTLDKKTKIASINPNLDGTFSIELPVGNYIIDFESTQINRIGGSNLPLSAIINTGDTSILNINIDTGIR